MDVGSLSCKSHKLGIAKSSDKILVLNITRRPLKRCSSSSCPVGKRVDSALGPNPTWGEDAANAHNEDHVVSDKNTR